MQKIFDLDRSQYKYGLINHALAGALREVVQVRIPDK
jgi:hypothetical protein